MQRLQSASKISIHLNPRDYIILKSELNFGSFVTLQEDPNVTAGGVVIASDLGNFDGNIDVKVKTMLESLDAIS
jgi:flagellar assembly protein FliH